MSTFAYIAFNAKGELSRGSVQEKSWTQAIRRVKEMGLFPTSVKEKSPRVSASSDKARPTWSRAPASNRTNHAWLSGISIKALTAFTRQMATLIEAGIPILKGLRSIEQQEENRSLRAVLRKIIDDIEGGSMFSEALARHPKVFSKLYINMILAGETAGMLEGTLARLADFLERTQKIRSKIVAALFYPASVICVAFGILSILTVFVIPKFKEVFADLTGSAALPPFTQLVMDGSQLFKSHFLLLSGLLVASVMALRLANATPTGRAAFDRIKLRLPVFGRITRKAAIGRFARTLGTMLENGVPVLQALTIARETTSNAVFAQAVQKTHDQVKEGETITAPLHASGIFPATVISMIDVGEQTGALPNMLLKVADNYDDEVDNTIASALSLLEPALIIFLAVVVGSIVIALFLPLLGIIDHGLDGGPGQGGE